MTFAPANGISGDSGEVCLFILSPSPESPEILSYPTSYSLFSNLKESKLTLQVYIHVTQVLGMTIKYTLYRFVQRSPDLHVLC